MLCTYGAHIGFSKPFATDILPRWGIDVSLKPFCPFLKHSSLHTALNSMPFALCCPMPYALCPMLYASSQDLKYFPSSIFIACSVTISGANVSIITASSSV